MIIYEPEKLIGQSMCGDEVLDLRMCQFLVHLQRPRLGGVVLDLDLDMAPGLRQ